MLFIILKKGLYKCYYIISSSGRYNTTSIMIIIFSLELKLKVVKEWGEFSLLEKTEFSEIIWPKYTQDVKIRKLSFSRDLWLRRSEATSSAGLVPVFTIFFKTTGHYRGVQWFGFRQWDRVRAILRFLVGFAIIDKGDMHKCHFDVEY